MTRWTLAYDLGGTRIKAGLLDEQGLVAARTALPTDGHRGKDDVLARMIGCGRQLMADAKIEQIAGVGVACTGVIDSGTGTVVLLNGKIPDIEGTSIADPLRDAFGVPCAVDNDARAFVIGEWKQGAAKGRTDVVGVTIGTGFGSGAIIDSQIFRTRAFLGGILGGHFAVDALGPLCSCGNRGCLETVGSLTALLNAVRDHLRRGCASSLTTHWQPDGDNLNGEVVLNAYAEGDELAGFVVDRWLQYLGAGIVTLIHAYDPEIVVIGGGVMQAESPVVASVASYVERHAWTTRSEPIAVMPAALGDDAALMGAANLIDAAGDPQ